MAAQVDHPQKSLIQEFFRLYPDEAARELARLSPKKIAGVLSGYSVSAIVAIFDKLPMDLGSEVLGLINRETSKKVLSQMDPVNVAHLLAGLPPEERESKLSLLDPRRAKMIASIMSYPHDCAGGIMDPQFITFRPDSTVTEALTRLRELKDKRIYDVFVVDSEGRLMGSISLQKIAVSKPHQTLGTLYQIRPVSIHATATREEILELLEHVKVDTLAVVNFEGKVIGVIRHEAVVEATQEEASVDIQTMVGASKEERALSPAGFAVKKRLPWLQINLLTAFLAAAVVGVFENIIAQFTALAVLLPVVAGQSGNTGAQALAVTMRGLALREIRVFQWLKVFFKEFKVGLVNGVAVALTTSLAVYVWSQSLGLMMVIGFSMVLSMIAAGVAGTAVPIVLTAVGQDPAQSSSIILTTITDVFGFFSFLGIATLLSGML